MPEMLSPAHIELRTRMQRFAEDSLRPIEASLESGLPEDDARIRVIESSKGAGFYGMTQPVEYGGTAGSPLEMTVVRETLASSNLRVARYVFGSRPGVLGAAEGKLREAYLAPMMRGDKRGGFAFTEPDNAPRPTWAVQDGDELVITGRKSFITGGTRADFISALVNVEKDGRGIGGTAMVVIDKEAAGVTLDKEFRTLEGGDHVAMTFEAVRVPKWHVIGKLGEGMPRALQNISTVRLSLSAEACGMMRSAIDFVTEYIKAPHRSRVPLGNREGVRLRYSDMRIEAYAARSMLYRTARLVESEENDVNEVMATKVFCTEALSRVVDTAIQLVGGNALTIGHPLERLYRQARAMRFTEGASDVLRLNIAKGKLELGKGEL